MIEKRSGPGEKRAPRAAPGPFGALGLAAFAAACATSAPIHAPPRAPGAPGPLVIEPPSVGQPRFVSAPYMSCVPYARQRSGVMIQGDANTWWPQAQRLGYAESFTPVPGAVMALRIAGDRGHVAFVKSIAGPREIIIDHANWHGRGEVAVDVPVIDVSPANDWSQVRVFWVESGQMGARTYPVEGFILPFRSFAAG